MVLDGLQADAETCRNVTVTGGVARWRIDGGRFVDGLVGRDLLARTATVLDGHAGTPVYYLYVLQKDQYDWLAVLIAGVLLFPLGRKRLRTMWATRHRDQLPVLIAVWAAVTLIIPMTMATKLAYCIDPFFPVCALGVGCVLAQGLSRVGAQRGQWRRRVLVGVTLVALGIAEGKLLWYSWHKRDLASSTQGLVLAERRELAHRRVFASNWNHADRFVVEALVGARPAVTVSVKEFLSKSHAGDYLVSTAGFEATTLELVRSNRDHALYRRTDDLSSVSRRHIPPPHRGPARRRQGR